MTLVDRDKAVFAETLHRYLSPASPIQSLQHLHGRELQLREIEEALYAPGRHIFIFGDRGVGKTSLAQTAAFSHQASDRDPILLSCDRSTTFYGLMRSLLRRLVQTAEGKKSSKVRKGKIGLGPISYESTTTKTDEGPPELADMNGVIQALREATKAYRSKSIVVVDEFDLVVDPQEKELFADFIKQLGDQQLRIQFIFCGIGESLDQLLGAHGSCYRYLANIEVPRLFFGARFEIIDSSATALGVNVGDMARFRIAAISDGFPHYVHLICEKLYWELFNDPDQADAVSTMHYSEAIRAAVRGIQQELRRAYDKATMKEHDDFHHLLWSAADHSNLRRRTDEIYASYLAIVKRLGVQSMERKKAVARLAALRKPGCGEILASKSRGWYEFRESILRGYVRLRAEAEGVTLAREYGDSHGPQVTARPKRERPLKGWKSLRWHYDRE